MVTREKMIYIKNCVSMSEQKICYFSSCLKRIYHNNMLLFLSWPPWVIKDLKYTKDTDILNFRKNESHDFLFCMAQVLMLLIFLDKQGESFRYFNDWYHYRRAVGREWYSPSFLECFYSYLFSFFFYFTLTLHIFDRIFFLFIF